MWITAKCLFCLHLSCSLLYGTEKYNIKGHHKSFFFEKCRLCLHLYNHLYKETKKLSWGGAVLLTTSRTTLRCDKSVSFFSDVAKQELLSKHMFALLEKRRKIEKNQTIHKVWNTEGHIENIIYIFFFKSIGQYLTRKPFRFYWTFLLIHLLIQLHFKTGD